MPEGVYVPQHMEHKEYASKGIAGTALGLGIGALGLNVLQGNGLSGLFGSNNCNQAVSYESKEAACLRSENATLRAERYADSVAISAFKDMVSYVEKQTDKTNSNLKEVTSEVIAQGNRISKLESGVQCLNQKLDYEIAATKSELGSAIMLEGERRVAADNAIWCKIPVTELKIPASTVCPQPMPRYNTWEAPETTPAATPSSK